MSKEVTVEELDQAIMEANGNSQFKVARVLTDVEKKTNVELDDIVQRLCELIDDGILKGFGDFNNWRHSEVRKKTSFSP